MTTKHSVTVGQFFYCSWGYDQTQVDFYRVVAVTPASVKIQKWQSATDENGRVVAGGKPATYTDWSAVDQSADFWTQQDQKIERDAKVQTKRVRSSFDGEPALTMTSYSSAYLWDGASKYVTPAGAGH